MKNRKCREWWGKENRLKRLPEEGMKEEMGRELRVEQTQLKRSCGKYEERAELLVRFTSPTYPPHSLWQEG